MHIFQQTITNKNLAILWICFLSVGPVRAQTPLVHLTFSEGDKARNKEVITPNQALYSLDLMRQNFTVGIKDYALDLSENAMYRRPWVLDSLITSKIHTDSSFSVQVWVRTLPGALQGTPIIGNKKSDDPNAPGWIIYSQENGAWALNLSDGEVQHHYIPTGKQRINDGAWHQIVLSIERPKNEARMYFDGALRAVYNLSSLGNLHSGFRTIAGGSDEYFEWGSSGQWKAFNGFLDEVKIWNRVVSVQEVQENWTTFFPDKVLKSKIEPQQIKVMAWNIWHGGRRYGEKVGVQRTIDIIRASQADIICLIETYGSGEEIADALGFYFYLISSNLSIMSRYPITTTIEAFRPFNFGGAIIQLDVDSELLVLDTWLHYLPDYLDAVKTESTTAEALIEAEVETRLGEIQAILKSIQPFLKDESFNGIIMAGDFNSGSHLDWIEKTKNMHKNLVVEWPVSKAMTDAGFKDSYRTLHINPVTDPGYTWTPRAATSSDKYGIRDRIDYIYYQGKGIKPIFSKVIDYHPIMFPSDHAGVVTVFKLD